MRQEGVDPDGRGCGEKLGGVEGAEAIIRIYYVEKEVIFNKRKIKYVYHVSMPTCVYWEPLNF